MNLTSKIIKYKVVLQRCNLPFFILKRFFFILKTIDFNQNLEITQTAGGGGHVL